MSNDPTRDPEVRRLVADRLAGAALEKARAALAAGHLDRAKALADLTEGFVRARDRSGTARRSRRVPPNRELLDQTRTRP
jgi:hypothetical protein